MVTRCLGSVQACGMPFVLPVVESREPWEERRSCTSCRNSLPPLFSSACPTSPIIAKLVFVGWTSASAVMLVISPCTTVSCNWIRLIFNHFTLNMLTLEWFLKKMERRGVDMSGSGQGPMADSWTQWRNLWVPKPHLLSKKQLLFRQYCNPGSSCGTVGTCLLRLAFSFARFCCKNMRFFLVVYLSTLSATKTIQHQMI